MEKPHYKDPDISYGAFRVLPRTDGRWAIIDERRAPGDRTIMTFKTLAEADVSAKAWHEQGHG